MDTKKFTDFLLENIERIHRENLNKIKDKGLSVQEDEKSITFIKGEKNESK